jgi:hypothetical protein
VTRSRSWATIRPSGVALGRERSDDEGDLEAEVVRVGDNAAEAVDLAGEDVRLQYSLTLDAEWMKRDRRAVVKAG